MQPALKEIIESYNASASLSEAYGPPGEWYTDPRILDLERRTVLARSWHLVGRVDQLHEPGQYVTAEVAGEPILIVRGTDRVLRGFFNVCRHKGAAIMTETEGRTQNLRCPYHGWTYTSEGKLQGTPDFAGVRNFEPSANGLIPAETAAWERWVFVRLDPAGASLEDFLGADLSGRIALLGLQNLHWFERRHYTLECNWKVFVDNYLDGGYHVPHLHGGLNSVLDYSKYTIETGARFCLQSSPLVTARAEAKTGAVRKGKRAFYLWIYPNLMINMYDGVLDTNLVCARGVDRTEVIFDFYFANVSEGARERNLASIDISERIQAEDVAICNSVQRGLASRGYRPGRLSVRREAGEHLFHRLLYADLLTGLA
jgi:choline monooxygenase